MEAAAARKARGLPHDLTKQSLALCQGLGLNLAGLSHRRYSCVMRPLRYYINVTLDGCCDHRAMIADEDLHRHAAENLGQADALLFGRVTYKWLGLRGVTSEERIAKPLYGYKAYARFFPVSSRGALAAAKG
jgi:hypothetical protein